jgi:hypothetical protein
MPVFMPRPRAVAVGDLRRHRPRAHVADGERNVAADGPADDRRAGALVERLDRLRLGIVGVHEHPRAVDVVGHERAGALGVDRPVEDRRARPHECPEVGLEVDHDERLQAVRADHLDPERPADAAAGAVGGDDVPAPDLVALAAREVLDVGGDAVRVGPQALTLVAVGDGGERLGAEPLEQHRLEEMLGEVQQGRRRVDQAVVALAFVGEAAELLPREARHPDDLRAVRARRGEAAEPVDVDADGAADLERPRVHDVSLRCAMRPGATLDDAAGDALPREQDRGHHPDGPAADDEDGDVDARHAGTPCGTARRSARAAARSRTDRMVNTTTFSSKPKM